MTQYPATPVDIFYSGGASGDPDVIEGTFPDFGRVDFGWAWGGVIGADIVGFKLVFDASAGAADLQWAIEIDNPGYPSSPQWTADPDSHIGLNNTYDLPASAIQVDGPTHYEWTFVNGDPTFGGFSFVDPLSDLLISLDRGPAGSWVTGSLQALDVTVPVVVTRFELVLFTRSTIPPRRQYPRPVTRIWPPQPSQLGTRTGPAAVI